MNLEIITSRENQRLKEVRRVRDGKLPELLFVEGVRLCEEALRSPVKIEDCYYTEQLSSTNRGEELLRSARGRGAKIFALSEKAFDSISDTTTPQGVALTCRRPERSYGPILESLEKPTSIPVVIFLDRINNPSNLGAIARTAEAAGAAGLVTSTHSADIYSPKALRASMGAALRLNILQDVPFSNVVLWAKANGLLISVAAGRAKHSYTDLDWTLPRLLIFGSEAHGLDESELSQADDGVRIPMKNNVESLNIAVSSGILLFEAVRQNNIKV